MKAESSIKPNKFKIEDLGNGKLSVSFFSNIEEVEITQMGSEETSIKYVYDVYKIELKNRVGLTEEIEEKFESWIDFAKDCEYMELASKIREKRNKLLEDTDKEMCIDRLDLNFPEDLSMTNIISSLKDFFDGFANISKSNIAKYRQELRDITKQEGFPYHIVWPTKDENKED